MRIRNNNEQVFTGNPLEVKITECNGDFNKMIKKFTRKVRKEEILKPFYGKLMYFETKGQKRRAKKAKGTYNTNKRIQKMYADEE